MLTTSEIVSSPIPATVSAEAYLAAEYKSPERNEFFRGEVHPMEAPSRAHSLIITNLLVTIGNTLFDEDYEVYSVNMRTHNPVWDSYFYPDVVVVKGTPQLTDYEFDTLHNPVLVVEVLSEGTEAFDRGDMALVYRQVPSLREYLLVSQDKAVVQHWVRLPDNKWQVEDY